MRFRTSLGLIFIFLVSYSSQFDWSAFDLRSLKFLRHAEAQPKTAPVKFGGTGLGRSESASVIKPNVGFESVSIGKREVAKAKDRYLRRYERQAGTAFIGECNSATDKCIWGGDYIPDDPCVNLNSTHHTCACRPTFTLAADGVCKLAAACDSADCNIFGYDSGATCSEDPTSATGYICTCTAPYSFSTTYGTCLDACDFASTFLGQSLCTGPSESGPCVSDPTSIKGYSCSCASGLTWNSATGACEAPVCECSSTMAAVLSSTTTPATAPTSSTSVTTSSTTTTPASTSTTTTPTTTSSTTTTPTTTSTTPTTTTTTPTTTTTTPTTTSTTPTTTSTTPTTTTTTPTTTTTTPTTTTTTPTTTTTTPTTTSTTPTTTSTTPTTTSTTPTTTSTTPTTTTTTPTTTSTTPTTTTTTPTTTTTTPTTTTTTPTTTTTTPTTTSTTPTTTTTTPTTTTTTLTTTTTTPTTTTTTPTTTSTTPTTTTTTPTTTTTTPTTTTTTPTTTTTTPTTTTTTPTTTTTTPTTTTTTPTTTTTTVATTTTPGVASCTLTQTASNAWTVSSPGYTGKYPVPDTICKTTITYPAGRSFSISFTVFEVSSTDTACTDGYVQFSSSGGTNAKLCGVKTGSSLTAAGNTLTIYLDGSATLQGRFSFNIRAV